MKVTINDAPADGGAPNKKRGIEVTDETGRKILVKKPNPLANLDFAKAAGSERLNVLYIAEVTHLKFVAEIDGEQIHIPTSERELRALYARLGDEGNEAVQKAVAEHFSPGAANLDEEVKNS